MLSTLKNLVQEMNQVVDFDDALSLLVVRLKEVTGVDCCSVYLANHQLQHFQLKATEGLSKSAIGKVTIGFSEGLIGLIGQREEPINIEDAHLHPRFKQYPEVKEEKYHAFLGTPIIHQRKVLGVITLQQKATRLFNEDEEALLVTIAAQIALEIVHAQARGAMDVRDDAHRSKWQSTLHGVPGSEGIAIGTGYVANRTTTLANQALKQVHNPEPEIERYRDAVIQTRAEVQDMADRMLGNLPEDVHAIFDMYMHLLDAASLGLEVEDKIRAGWSAISGLKMVVEHYVNTFRNMQDSYMRERAVDVEDLGNKILGQMLQSQETEQRLPERTILIAEEITASMLAEYPPQVLAGIVSMRGSQNSHAAIMARAMGLPSVMGLTDVPVSMLSEQDLILDGYSGAIIVSPDENILSEYQQLADEELELFEHLQGLSELPNASLDECDVKLLINAGLSIELENTHSSDDDGVGLYRTEVPFMMRERFPSEKEQVELYRSMLMVDPNKTITMRTLDVGGDKPLPYLPITEENPFLGWRGIRLTLDHPEIFLVQVRAMLKASLGLTNLKIMLPMVSSVNEVDEAFRLVRQAFFEVSEETRDSGQTLAMPQLGVMLEVPAVLYQIPQLASRVDFFSIGSNDLTQYLLAIDRNNARVSALYDSYHPAVLRALKFIIDQASRLEKPVTLCGEMAGEPGGALLLFGMGYRQLSMNRHSLLKIKWVIRSVTSSEAEALVDELLQMNTPEEVREALNLKLEILGLGGLVRAGK
ncbi:phosphoenolpyruvate--protein phosphotransferase [Neptunicella marina]|uniref:phosphoenolpyruvate--protein phosphotransferase n=1 Tax=Neptunicella marina TaxID=2125989 RepID=A0A8J6LYT0_9ALTE|nr:phosphoenolpyruvate--protein phosphotransferase [Neptunicella marina]MBC3766299.1 phosphoenolpyruvate--protein phosphotransferase [Neptunicella marina]